MKNYEDLFGTMFSPHPQVVTLSDYLFMIPTEVVETARTTEADFTNATGSEEEKDVALVLDAPVKENIPEEVIEVVKASEDIDAKEDELKVEDIQETKDVMPVSPEYEIKKGLFGRYKVVRKE